MFLRLGCIHTAFVTLRCGGGAGAEDLTDTLENLDYEAMVDQFYTIHSSCFTE